MTGSPDARRCASPEDLGLGPELGEAGLNLAGWISRERYDEIVPAAWRAEALLPEARSVVVLASGGAAFHDAAMARRGADSHPLDGWCEANVVEAAERLTRAGSRTLPLFYWERRGAAGPAGGGGPDPVVEGCFADFVALAREAGLGVPSRLGLLLHPEFGPWIGIRALLLSEREPAAGVAGGEPLHRFAPCDDCPAPCIGACHGHAVKSGGGAGEPLAGFLGEACGEARQGLASCRERCDARLACPVGRNHAYPPAELAYHMTASFRGQLEG